MLGVVLNFRDPIYRVFINKHINKTLIALI